MESIFDCYLQDENEVRLQNLNDCFILYLLNHWPLACLTCWSVIHRSRLQGIVPHVASHLSVAGDCATRGHTSFCCRGSYHTWPHNFLLQGILPHVASHLSVAGDLTTRGLTPFCCRGSYHTWPHTFLLQGILPHVASHLSVAGDLTTRGHTPLFIAL